MRLPWWGLATTHALVRSWVLWELELGLSVQAQVVGRSSLPVGRPGRGHKPRHCSQHSFHPRGPAPVAMGTAAAARLARVSPSSFGLHRSRGGWGGLSRGCHSLRHYRRHPGKTRAEQRTSPGRERGCGAVGPRLGPRVRGARCGWGGGDGWGRGSWAAENKGSGMGTSLNRAARAPGPARSHLLCAGGADLSIPVLALRDPTCEHC